MVMVNIFCTGPGIQTQVCHDARLRNRLEDRPRNWWGGVEGEPLSRGDRVYGQAGWDLGVRFSSLVDLRTRLWALEIPEWVSGDPRRRIRAGECRKLSISAHGDSGVVFTSGERLQRMSDRSRLSRDTIEANRADLAAIARIVKTGGVIYLMACRVGGNRDFMEALSGGPWRDRYVVAYTDTGYAHGGGMRRETEEMCTEPGMRDPGRGWSSGQDDGGAHPQWRDLNVLPWATATSPSAVVAWNGAYPVPRNALPLGVD